MRSRKDGDNHTNDEKKLIKDPYQFLYSHQDVNH
jgi:hypothetical protein